MATAAIPLGAFTSDALQKLLGAPPVQVQAAGAIDPHTSNRYVVTNGAATALTLAAPTPGIDDGREIYIGSATTFAHSITSTGNLQTGSASVNSITFPAQAGAGVWLMAYNGKWIITGTGAGNYVYA